MPPHPNAGAPVPVPTPRRPRPARRQSPPLWPFALVALAAHGALWGLCALGPGRPKAPPGRPKTALTLPAGAHAQALSAARQALQQAQAPQPPSKRPPQPKPPEPLSGTVVALPPSADDRSPPPDSAFLAEHNARVAKQTRSQDAAPDHPHVMNELSRAQRAERPASGPPPLGRGGDGAVGERHRAAKPLVAAHLPQEHRDRLQLRQDAAGTARNQQAQQASPPGPVQLRLGPSAEADTDAQAAAQGRGGQALGAPLSMAQLIPSVGALAQLQGGPKNDVGHDIEAGDGTFLNAREFRYAGFFNRLKEQIANYWRPLPEYARRDPTGNIYGMQNRLTVLTIALTEEGALHELKVLQSSGIPFLDDAGVEAIRAAAPFAHPPRGLLNADKLIVFNFAFSVDVTGRYAGPP